jgi:hypothetical protein
LRPAKRELARQAQGSLVVSSFRGVIETIHGTDFNPTGKIRFAPKSKIVVGDQADLVCPALIEKIF